MIRETIHPTSREHWLELRTKDITSTESAVLFGLSPYATPFELWHAKRDATVAALPDNERMLWGRRLQDAIAHGVAEDLNLTIRPMEEYIRYPGARIGSSFDFYYTDNATYEVGILEIKNVDFIQYRNEWMEEGIGMVAPPHIELQVQHQMLTAGLQNAIIAPLVAGNSVKPIRRKYDVDVGRGIVNAVSDFWRSIDNNTPPTPDFRQDYDAIKRVYGYAEPGKLFDAKGNTRVMDLIRRYHACAENAKVAEMDKKAAAAEILTIVGDHEKIIGDDGFTVSCGMVGPAEIPAFTRAGYRNLRVYKKADK